MNSIKNFSIMIILADSILWNYVIETLNLIIKIVLIYIILFILTHLVPIKMDYLGYL